MCTGISVASLQAEQITGWLWLLSWGRVLGEMWFILILTSRLIFSTHQPLDPLTKPYILHSTGPSSPLPVLSLLFCDCQISRGLRCAYLHVMKGVSFVNGAPISWRNTLDKSFAKPLHAVQSSGPFLLFFFYRFGKNKSQFPTRPL